ncbi:RNA-directed DNA polymerase from mobile element jockey-like [Brachionus plicatilis]|uniref:RNA-directed DNA polymerase from mobile element jockey-like n=1 Tax=Brachionus plicatilis TaxID=10195 RepID=A0A3M7T7K3_BRAPC|nr:RNA-directed DNA polymerase from mobile element jockey-like [Brachionus plicatilis]
MKIHNDHFYNKLTNSIFDSEIDIGNCFGEILKDTFSLDNDFINKQSIKFVKITLSELKEAINKAKDQSAMGFDKIHNKMLKNLPNPFLIRSHGYANGRFAQINVATQFSQKIRNLIIPNSYQQLKSQYIIQSSETILEPKQPQPTPNTPNYSQSTPLPEMIPFTQQPLISNQEEKQNYTLSICTLNCKNLLGNFHFVNELTNHTDIIFLQETWLKTSKQGKQLLNKDFKFIHKSSMAPEYSVGRPHGGTGWLIKKEIHKIANIEFVSDRISLCQINNTYLIGVNMNFEGPADSVVKFEALIGQITNLIDKIYREKTEANICILGDFNTDLNHKNPNEITQPETLGKSRIDHVLANEFLTDKVEQINILSGLEHQSNTSDHYAIKIDLKNIGLKKIDLKRKSIGLTS